MKSNVKLFLLLAVVVWGLGNMAVQAGYSGYGGRSVQLDFYDTPSGMYFKTITRRLESNGFLSKVKTMWVSDLYILDPATGKGRLLFNDGNVKRRLGRILMETGYDTKTESISFEQGWTVVKNNVGIAKRPLKNRILIVEIRKKQPDILWSVEKSGAHLQKLRELRKGENWHIDVKNGKLRFFWPEEQSNHKMKIHYSELPW